MSEHISRALRRPAALWSVPMLRCVHWMNTDLRNSLLCAVLVSGSVLATVPILEMGVNDDWSYTYTTRELASSGRLTYNGWGEPMVGVQAYWGALIIKLFGFSFTAVRLSTIVFAVGSALMLYGLARYAGLQPVFALFGALVVALSPLFLPLAASFMTDVPALFFLLVCVYFGVRVLGSKNPMQGSLWIAAAALAGLLGGTIRQIVWGLPLLMIPSIAWIKRRDRRLLVMSVLLWSVVLLAVLLCFQWLHAQPYSSATKLHEWFPGAWPSFAEVLTILVKFVRASLLLVLPVSIMHLSGWRGRPKLWFTILPAILLFCVLWKGTSLRSLQVPWFGNIITEYGIMRPGLEAMGSKPPILSPSLVTLVSLIVFGAAAVCAMALLHSIDRSLTALPKMASPTVTHPAPSLAGCLLLFAPFCFCYSIVVVFRYWEGFRLDRYLLPLLPALVIPLLWHHQQRIQQRVPAVGWVVLGLLGAYGIATTHDYLASARARLQAASTLVANGVPRTWITAGLEYDGWTQIEQTGHITGVQIRVPLGVNRRPISPGYWLWDRTPSIQPRYFVVYSPDPSLIDSPFPPVRYKAWLPPFRRQVLTQKLLSGAGCCW